MIKLGNLTIYNNNSHFTWGHLYIGRYKFFCFWFPTITGWKNKDRRWHLFLSPNATPWACTWYIGDNKDERIRARIRRHNFGLVYKPDGELYERLYSLNNKFDRFYVEEYDVKMYGTHTINND